MISTLKTTVRTLVLGAAAASLATTIAVAGPIEDRQQAMKNVGKAMGQLAAIAKKEAAFDAAVVKSAGEMIADSVKVFKANFPKDSKEGPPETWAKPEIWTNIDDFNMKSDKSVEAAMAMAAVTEEASFGAALGELGGSCKACHQDYRRPKE